jgi:hypothetical protein
MIYSKLHKKSTLGGSMLTGQVYLSVMNVKKKLHNIMGLFVTNLRKRHKSMGLVSSMLIYDENIVSVTDSACL